MSQPVNEAIESALKPKQQPTQQELEQAAGGNTGSRGEADNGRLRGIDLGEGNGTEKLIVPFQSNSKFRTQLEKLSTLDPADKGILKVTRGRLVAMFRTAHVDLSFFSSCLLPLLLCKRKMKHVHLSCCATTSTAYVSRAPHM